MSKIALLPGGFKPPHAGHYNMAKWLHANTGADTTIIFVGPGVRGGTKTQSEITQKMSFKLWEIYTQNDSELEVRISSVSPVGDVYDFVEKEAPEGTEEEESEVFLGIGAKDKTDKRYANIGKFAEPRNIKYKPVVVPPQAGGVSGTEMRGFIKMNDKVLFQYSLPEHLSDEQKEQAWNIVIGLNEDLNENILDSKYITIKYDNNFIKLKDVENKGAYVQASDIKIVDKDTEEEDPNLSGDNKPFANPDNAENIPDEIKGIRGDIFEGILISTNDSSLKSSKNKTIKIMGLSENETENAPGRKFIIQTEGGNSITATFTSSELNEDLYDPNDHVLDYMKSSEFKAGYTKKDDIPPGYKYRRGGQYSAASGQGGAGTMYEADEKGKTLHAYDFDDTIAQVKANIRTTITSPKGDYNKEILIPAANFPEESKELEARLGNLNIEYDFSEFEKQIGDAIVNSKVVSKLKDSLSNPQIKTTILTARSIGHPVTRYLKSIGLDAYVVPLGLQVDGKVTGQDKANWIENHIKKGYQTIYFIDDSEENRTAVAALKDKYPDISLTVEDPAAVSEMMGTMNNQEKAKHAKNLKRLKKDTAKQGDQYMEVPKYLKGTLTRKLYELSDKEQEIVDDILSEFNTLNEFDFSKLKSYGKKGLLTLAILLSVASQAPAQNTQDIVDQGIEMVDRDYQKDFNSAMVGLAVKLSNKGSEKQFAGTHTGDRMEEMAVFKEIRHHYEAKRDGKKAIELSPEAKKEAKIMIDLLIKELDKGGLDYYVDFGKNITSKDIYEEMSAADIDAVEDFADKKLDPVDVDLTSNHFFDRLNDPRNKKEISGAELIGFFKRLSKRKKEFIEFLKQYKELVVTDDRTNINIPFMKLANKAIAKTVMRKPNFQTSNPSLTLEENAFTKNWWKQQLTEVITETKANTHLTHLEELVLTQGQDGYNKAKSFLYELIKNLKGESNNIKNVSVKWDGAPAVWAGINPENGKFFVGTKSIFGKTEQKINYTPQDIDKYHGHAPGLVKKLKLALQYLPALGIKNILQGDFMFDSDDVETEDIDGAAHYTFEPNTIKYAIEANSEIGKKILNAKIGVIWHTTYNSLEEGDFSFGADVSGLSQTPSVWFDDAYFKDDTGVLLSNEEEEFVLDKIKEADSLNVDYDALPDELSSRVKTNMLNTYLNSEVRVGEFINDPNKSFERFKNWYQSAVNKSIEKVKRPESKERKRKAGEEKLKLFNSKKNIVINLFKVSKLLSEAKNIFIAKYDKAVATKHFIDNGDGTLRVTKAEGFVAVDHTENGIKLVDRLEFSKNNFNAGKPGEKK